MQIRVLGPVQVVDREAALPLGGAKQRAVLAMLALQANQVVSSDALIDGLWGSAPPDSAANALQGYVSRLRKAVNRADRAVLLERRPPGYLLTVDPRLLDLALFEELAAQARALAKHDPAGAVLRFREALGLWRGEPLVEFTDEPFALIEAPLLRERRLAAVTALIDAELAAGRHVEVYGELADLVNRHPLNERLAAQLMVGSYRAGRQAEALEVFRRIRRILTTELGVEPGSALQALEAAILAHDPALEEPSAERAGIAARRVWGIPARSLLFTGRAELLDRMAAQLRSGRTTVITAIHGMGGVGKTTTAIEYAHRFAEHYDIAWWVPAENPALIPARLAELARALNLASATDDSDAAVARLLGALRDLDRWLLIFDNAEEPATVTSRLPTGSGHTLITSRNPDWQGAATGIAVQLFDRAESVALLQSRIPSISADDAAQIAGALGDLPLAVSQAAALLSDTGLDASAYVTLLGTRTREVLAHQPAEALSAMAVSWAVAVDRLAADEPAALQLLTLAAWLAPEPIPLRLLTNGPDLLPQPLAADLADPLAVGRLLGIIRRRGMAQVQPGSMTLHRVPAALLRAGSSADPAPIAGWPATVAGLLVKNLPDDPFNNRAAWPHWRAGLAHVLAAVAPDRAAAAAVGDVTRLLRRAGEYLLSRGGDPRAALPLLERANQLNSAHLAADDPETLDTVGFLANVLNTLGEHDRAGELNRQTLAHRLKTLGPDHPSTLRAGTNYAIYLRSVHRNDRACELNEDAFARAGRSLGRDHPLTMAIANGLAINLSAIGRSERARELDEDTLSRSQRLLGDDHPDTLSTAHNLGNDLRRLGEYELARDRDEHTANRLAEVLGENHHDTLGALSNVALDLHGLGEYGPARDVNADIHRRCLELLGEDHPQTLWIAHNLAADLRALGDVAAAAALDEDTLNRRRRALRPDHPNTLASAHNLATDLAALGQFERARQLDQDTLARSERVLGESHPATVASSHNLTLDHPAAGTARWETRPINDLSAFR